MTRTCRKCQKREQATGKWFSSCPPRRLVAGRGLSILVLLALAPDLVAGQLQPRPVPNREEAVGFPVMLVGTENVDLLDPGLDRATGSLTLAVANRGQAAITALSVNLLVERSGLSLGRYTTDAYPVLFTHQPDPNRPEADGVILGGETERITIPVDIDSIGSEDGLMAVLVVAVFADHRFEGSASSAKEIFSTRAQDLRDLELWTARLVELAAPADSNPEALSVLQQMRKELARVPSSRAGRRLFDQVQLKLREAADSPSETSTLLNHLVEFTRSDVTVMRQVVPPTYRRPRKDTSPS